MPSMRSAPASRAEVQGTSSTEPRSISAMAGDSGKSARTRGRGRVWSGGMARVSQHQPVAEPLPEVARRPAAQAVLPQAQPGEGGQVGGGGERPRPDLPDPVVPQVEVDEAGA